MVTGKSMLSSASSSLLLSPALSPPNAAGGAAGPLAGGQPMPGFAELLSALPAQATSLSVSIDLPDEPATIATANEGIAMGLQTQGAPALAASAAKAATATGKILPVVLSEAAETGPESELLAKHAPDDTAEAQTDESAAAVIVPPPGVAIAPAPPTVQAGKPSPAAASTAPVASHPRTPTKAEPKPRTADGEVRSVATVPISVAARPEASPAAANVPAEPASASQPKTARAAERPRIEAPLPPHQPPSASLSAAQPDSASPAQLTQAASMPVSTASPADIDATLDRLMAAREALLPAEAALAVDHAEFGEVSIRFEQSSDGRLSAELSAADPELQRAVTAAVAADRGHSTGAESEGGRSMGQANPRGSAAGGEAGAREHGQAGNDRDLNQRRMPTRPQVEPGTADPHAGVFA